MRSVGKSPSRPATRPYSLALPHISDDIEAAGGPRGATSRPSVPRAASPDRHVAGGGNGKGIPRVRRETALGPTRGRTAA
ncbi:hypothetical protein [Oryza sativa Japonica Group]|uniref:Uncharacterized protein P0424A08.11 n=1 Tax=Oryza sativa subsp. japonica TaxID=39947 RepID=Q5NBN0_ORYSJ|nr:hypothetical protein [Oryza sativa Japonica Group]